MRSDGHQPDLEPMQRVGSALRARRKALRLDQASVAAMAGVGLAFLYELEHGKSTVRVDKLLAVLRVLGLSLSLQEGKQPVSIASELARDAE